MINRVFIISVIIACLAIVFSSCSKDDDNRFGTITDHDGNVYKTVTIGTQTWMAENLRTTSYKDSISITNVTGATEWEILKTGAYCNYNNTTNTNSIATYGRLYNWYAVNTGKLCPTGWHVPKDAEWTTLINFLGGEDTAGGKLKETGTTHWLSPNTGATNETGFTALPGGEFDGSFRQLGYYGIWWSASEGSSISALSRTMYSKYSYILSYYDTKDLGISVRCVKD